MKIATVSVPAIMIACAVGLTVYGQGNSREKTLVVQNFTGHEVVVKFIGVAAGANASMRVAGMGSKELKIIPPQGSDQVFIAWKSEDGGRTWKHFHSVTVPWETRFKDFDKLGVFINEDSMNATP